MIDNEKALRKLVGKWRKLWESKHDLADGYAYRPYKECADELEAALARPAAPAPVSEMAKELLAKLYGYSSFEALQKDCGVKCEHDIAMISRALEATGEHVREEAAQVAIKELDSEIVGERIAAAIRAIKVTP